MFTGRRGVASNVQIMQLFHEIKQQFPTVPDQVINACISSYIFTKNTSSRDISGLIHNFEKFQQGLMGRSVTSELTNPPINFSPLPCEPPKKTCDTSILEEFNNGSKIVHIQQSGLSDNTKIVPEMSRSINSNTEKNNASTECMSRDMISQNQIQPQRPKNLNIRPNTCRNNSNILYDNSYLGNKLHSKPPKSPSASKETSIVRNTKDVNSNECDTEGNLPITFKTGYSEEPNTNKNKKNTVETPTQTTDTLLGEPNVQFSVNFNCSMDYTQNNLSPRRMSQVQLTPVQPWLQQPVSQRNYTSVNLTLRPPSSEPQPPIDIVSKNSSLTYSTSSFDSQRGLQSRLQITVGPTGGSVSSLRTRPKSSYHPEETSSIVVPSRAESLPDLTVKYDIISRQQARIEGLRIELSTEKGKLIILRREIDDLENCKLKNLDSKSDSDLEEQLQLEIRHLRFQCEQLATEVNKTTSGSSQEHFYRNFYTGQRGSLNLDLAIIPRRSHHYSFFETNTKWNCHLCTFLNHPDLNKCEQCEMARILNGNTAAHTC